MVFLLLIMFMPLNSMEKKTYSPVSRNPIDIGLAKWIDDEIENPPHNVLLKLKSKSESALKLSGFVPASSVDIHNVLPKPSDPIPCSTAMQLGLADIDNDLLAVLRGQKNIILIDAEPPTLATDTSSDLSFIFFP